MIEKICDFCSKKFTVHSYRKSKAHFCSFECYNNYRAKLAYPKRICPQCKQKFSINRRTRDRKYCSQKCANLAQRKYQREDKICLYCGKKFKYKPKNPHQKFCSKACQYRNQTYEVNEKIFQRINTQEKAYLLGLVFSDGSISQHRLNFSSTDEGLVQIFKKLLNSSAPIHRYQDSFSLLIGNKTIYNSLRNQGVMERKSWKEYGLPLIPKSLIWHFIRGVFDGDGSFYIDNHDKWKYLCASFSCGSRRFLEGIKNQLEKCQIKTQNIRFDRKPNGKGCWQLRMARKEAIKIFIDYLYQTSHYFLNRKYKIVKKFYGK